MIPRPLLLRAAELIEREAQMIKQGCSLDGDWGDDTDAQKDYDEMVSIANELRRAAG